MKRIKVVSSNIKSIGWKDEVLEVEFNSGAVYTYKAVPIDIYKILMNAGSKGSAFHRYIKTRGYKYKKVG